MANKATLDIMNGLHGILAKYYTDYLNEANTNNEEVSSGFLTAVNAFLKNNNITVDVVESNELKDLGLSIKQLIKQEEE
jgi:hypothetical protein